MDNVGLRIKQARQQKGLSQQALADLTQVSQPTVANWEKGSHAPRHNALGKLSRVLETSPSWLLGETLYSNPSSLQSAFITGNTASQPPYLPLAAPQQKMDKRDNYSQHDSLPDHSAQNTQAMRLHHIPVLNWPDSLNDIYTSIVENYISLHIVASRPIALSLTSQLAQKFEDIAPLQASSTLIIDLGDTRPPYGGLCLIRDGHNIILRRINENDESHQASYRILGRAILLQQRI